MADIPFAVVFNVQILGKQVKMPPTSLTWYFSTATSCLARSIIEHCLDTNGLRRGSLTDSEYGELILDSTNYEFHLSTPWDSISLRRSPHKISERVLPISVRGKHYNILHCYRAARFKGDGKHHKIGQLTAGV